MTKARQIEKQAADWLARLDACGELPDRDRIDIGQLRSPGFSEWIEQSVNHRVAFLRLLATWQRTNRLAALRTATHEQSINTPIRTRRNLALGVAASIAVCSVAIALIVWTQPVDETTRIGFETVLGGRETVPLGDGSMFELNTSTRLQTRFSSDERVVILESGEAYFSVAPDKSRPFVVQAGHRRVTVTGTSFAVRHDENTFEVIVEHGSVAITGLVQGSGSAETVLQKGGQVLVDDDDVMIATRTDGEVAGMLGWREGMLYFDQTALVTVAEEFNRYNTTKLIIAEQQIESFEISGTHRVDNLDGFARLLNVYGFHTEFSADQIIVTRN